MSNQLATIKDELELIRPTFNELNLTGLSFAKEMEFAVQILEKNTYLQGAKKESISNALKNVALTGLSLNPVLKYCYLIPRKEKQILMCLAEPSYIGLIKILTDTGSVVGISATIVYEKEIPSLVIQEGIGGHATHTHYFGKEKPGRPVACYSIAVLPNGMKHVSLLREWQWEDIMQRSESVKSYYAKKNKGEYAATPVWLSDTEEMIRKTAIKNHYKYLPKTERAEMIGQAIDMDNQVNGINFEKEQQSNNVKTKTVSIDLLDPSNEEDIAAFSVFEEIMSSPKMPAEIDNAGKKMNTENSFNKIQEKFVGGSLHKEALRKYIEFYKTQLVEAQEGESEFE